MKVLRPSRLFIVSILCLLAQQIVFSQAEKLGAVSYTAPKGWARSAKENIVTFSEIDKAKGNFCFITLYGATPSAGNPQADFAREWNDLVVKPFGGEKAPKTEAVPDDGWTGVAGGGPIEFQGTKAFALLTVISGFGRTVSILGILNDDSFLPQLQAFVEGMDLDKPAATTAGPSPGSMQTAPASAASTVMNVNGLAKEFQDNEVRANQVWIGKRVRVNGVVNSISIVADGSIQLTFKTSITNNNMARCHFSKSQSASVASLTAHQEATVEGTVRGLGGGFDNSKTYFLLDDCTVP